MAQLNAGENVPLDEIVEENESPDDGDFRIDRDHFYRALADQRVLRADRVEEFLDEILNNLDRRELKFLLRTPAVLANRIVDFDVASASTNQANTPLNRQTSQNTQEIPQFSTGSEELHGRPPPSRNSSDSDSSDSDSDTDSDMPIRAKDLIPMVPDFSGKYRELDAFILIVDNLFDSLDDQTQQELFSKWIIAKLHRCSSVLRRSEDLGSWTMIKAALLRHLKPPLRTSAAISQLQNVKQKGDESVREYADRVKSAFDAVCQANAREADGQVHASVHAMTMRLAVNAFTDGLKNERLNWLVSAVEKENLDDAISYVLEKENRVEPKKCTYCNKEGHTANDCFSKKNDGIRNPNSITITCNYCGRPGHRANECRTRIHDNQFRSDLNRGNGSRNNAHATQNHYRNNNRLNDNNNRHYDRTDNGNGGYANGNRNTNGNGNFAQNHAWNGNQNNANQRNRGESNPRDTHAVETENSDNNEMISLERLMGSEN